MKKYNVELIEDNLVLTYRDKNMNLFYIAEQDFIRINDLHGERIQGIKPMKNIDEWHVYVVNNYDFLLNKAKSMNVSNGESVISQ